MNLTVERDDLSRALGIVSRAVAGKTALPVLANILLAADGDRLTLTGTDLTTSLRTAAGAKIAEPGSITLDPRVLAEWLRSLPDGGHVSIEVDRVRLRATFRSGGARITIAGIDAEDFPEIPAAPGEPDVLVPADVMRGMIARTVIATEPDAHNRPVLHGVQMRFRSDSLVMTAADGFRMTHESVDVATGVAPGADELVAIVPRESAIVLRDILPESEDDVELALAGPHRGILLAQVGSISWGTSLIEGTFPDVAQLLSRDIAATVTTDRRALQASVRGSRSLSAASKDIVSLQPDGEVLRVRAESDERGDAERELAASMVRGGEGTQLPAESLLNWKFLDDVLGVLDGERVDLAFASGADWSPVSVRDQSVPGYTCMMMPLVRGDRR